MDRNVLLFRHHGANSSHGMQPHCRVRLRNEAAAMNTRPILKGVTALIDRQEQVRASIGAAAMENAERASYQSARTKNGKVAPLPLTLDEAWKAAEKIHQFTD